MVAVKQLEKALRGKRVLVFLDLEGTQFSHEMIEIGAYKAYLRDDLTIRKIMGGFKSYVKPKSRIGHAVTDLTGITEKLIEEKGVPYRVVQQAFRKYVGKDWDKCLFVTFGSHDFRIISQSAENNMDASMEQARYVIHHAWDYSEFIARFIRDDKGNNYSLSNYLKLFDVDFEGQKHDALADAYNLIDLYKAFLAKPEIVMREYEKTLGLSRNHFPEPVRQVMAKLSQGEAVSPEEYASYIKEYLQ